ncbi:YfiT family bacillithiol transferase [Paenibacillus sp. MMS20-IR301]|uniref:YfiT family bacillithiol transferase n=1 Tax=Paenibacillus sp. MMS20-IR301 TaxID=2895946 RepID=UPI0028EA3EE9|nr:putative metal-dependent hydrolase [Paenibacillus sp. MMS20-IR301]WNS45912.1 putative metal-dependent hydrolase [Paenibacillus sp. MMS20-IR301]
MENDVSEQELEQLKYPVGKFTAADGRTPEQWKESVQMIRLLAAGLTAAVEPLTADQLNTPCRPGGWTVLQVVHHLADTGMYAYLRFKRGLTEDSPLVPSYRQDLWAEQSDYTEEPAESSLQLLELLNRRFVTLLNSLEESDYSKSFESAGLGKMTLDIAVQRYVWHNRHHLAQITALIQRSRW